MECTAPARRPNIRRTYGILLAFPHSPLYPVPVSKPRSAEQVYRQQLQAVKSLSLVQLFFDAWFLLSRGTCDLDHGLCLIPLALCSYYALPVVQTHLLLHPQVSAAPGCHGSCSPCSLSVHPGTRRVWVPPVIIVIWVLSPSSCSLHSLCKASVSRLVPSSLC